MMQHKPLPNPIWQAVDRQDFAALVREFNGSLADLPDDDLPQRSEAWYCSMFHAMLVGAGVPAHACVANSRGATDLVVQLGRCLYYIEFEFAGDSGLVARRLQEARAKLEAGRAGGAYAWLGWTVYHAAVVADNETGQAVWYCERLRPGMAQGHSQSGGADQRAGRRPQTGTPSRTDKKGGSRLASAGSGRRQERRPEQAQARARRRPAGS